MVKMELYVDTSVFGFLFEEEFIEKRRITEKFFKKVERGEIKVYISELVLLEIKRIPENGLKMAILELINRIEPEVLKFNQEIETLALDIIKMGGIPRKYIDDARHIAYAIFYEVDGIISWNMRHIVKLSTRRVVNAICALRGYKEIELLTPEEVIYESRI